MNRKTLAFALLLSVWGLSRAAVPIYTAGKVTEQFEIDEIGPPIYPFDQRGDWLVHAVPSGKGMLPHVAVRMRDANGHYKLVANITDFFSSSPTTNGEWIILADQDEETNEAVIMYQLENNMPVWKQSFEGDFAYDAVAFFGNVWVGEVFSFAGYFLDVFTYDGAKWNLNHSISLGDDSVIQPYDNMVSRDGKFFVTTNLTHANIWEFQVDASTFKVIESLEVDNLPAYNLVIYNGVDSVLATNAFSQLNSSYDSNGYFVMYTKIAGVWTQTQISGADDFGLRPTALMGTTGIWVHENLFLLCVPLENSNIFNDAADYGRVAGFMRNSNNYWDIVFQLDMTPGDNVSFGYNVLSSPNGELIMAGLKLVELGNDAFLYSSCITTFIDATCSNKTVDDCNNLPLDTLYTVHNTGDCGAVNVTVVNVSQKQDNQITVDYKFTKPYAMDVMCSSVVTCPIPAPVNAPVNAPVAGPVKAPTGKKSDSSLIELSVAVLAAVVLAM